MRACFILSAVFCVRIEDPFVGGVQGFSSRVFSALGMAQEWLPWEPPRSRGHDPAKDREFKRQKAVADNAVHDDAGPENQTRGRSSPPPAWWSRGGELEHARRPVRASCRADRR